MPKRLFECVDGDHDGGGGEASRYASTTDQTPETFQEPERERDSSSQPLDEPAIPASDSEDEDMSDSLPLVCYGALVDTKVRLFQNAVDTVLEKTEASEQWLYLQLVRRYSVVVLVQMELKLDVGILNNELSKAIFELPSSEALVCQIVIPNDRATVYEGSTIKSRSNMLERTADLLVCGPHEISQIIGDGLSRGHLFLQHLKDYSSEYPYRNPQWLVLDLVAPPSQPEDIVDVAMQEPEPPFLETDDAMTGDQELGLAGNINEHVHEQTEPQAIIQTKLQDHQKEALHFMLLHEQPEVPEQSSLWELADNETVARQTYQHRIVKNVYRPCREDVRGGILADETGLGKTLSVLSLIAHSLQDARLPKRSLQTSDLVPSCATLVVVSIPRSSQYGLTIDIKLTKSTELLRVWSDEIDKHFGPNTLKTFRYHGPRRDANLAQVHSSDVVLTTYDTVFSDYYRRQQHLHKADWYRIVLDEAHKIRSSNTKQFRAIMGLNTSRRWCVTATPIQNHTEDLGALVTFLRVPLLKDAAIFRKYMLPKLGASGLREKMSNLRLLLSCLCLRRLKTSLRFPDPVYHDIPLTFQQGELELYRRVERECRNSLYKASLSLEKATTESIMNTLQQLRIICDHGLNFSGDSKSLLSISSASGKDENYEHQVDTPGLAGVTSALLVKPGNNQPNVSESNTDLGSRSGGKLVDRKLMSRSQPSAIDSVKTSTKIEALRESIRSLHSQSKCIVFSAWTQSLELAAASLRGDQTSVYLVHGLLTVSARAARLEQFKSAAGKVVLLMTFGTGGEGLTLIDATHVYILEPQWNPQAEHQAIGRAVRMGQTRRVVVTRLFIKESIEMYVRDVQQRKVQLAGASFEEEQQGDAPYLASRLVNEIFRRGS